MTSAVTPRTSTNCTAHLVNTVDDPGGPQHHDHLGTADDIGAWAEAVGALAPERARRLAANAEEAADLVRRAQDLRTAVAGFFGAAADGTDLAAPWRALRPVVAEAVAHAELVGEPGATTHDWSHLPAADALLLAAAGAAGRLAVAPGLARIKRCGACPWVFLDRSKNGSRRWCDMGDCGTARKMERYTARRAARRRAARAAG
ncbi:CGNR zinc finger domain-containing protein [Pseudonocardia lacus]|uniref:CGNR zinc finger domain-containing protein n=1 Tax=Pseudonocardia lacus TaxID=2835865 RepID=UPI0027E2711B|nr:CGNR zinc finger domain-containing protein [Pseudonocardia lacus]